MAWVPGFVEFKTSDEQDYYEGNIQITKVDKIVFNGVVIDSNSNSPVSGALVKVFARTANSQELALCQTISGSDGYYLMHIDKEAVPAGTTDIVVRASAGN